jgi:hypothetical protein
MYCENEHNNHKIISYGKIFPNIENIKMKRDELKIKIDKFNNDIKEIINILNRTMENMEYYYNIINDIINNYNNKKINFEILYNINNIYNNNILKISLILIYLSLFIKYLKFNYFSDLIFP